MGSCVGVALGARDGGTLVEKDGDALGATEGATQRDPPTGMQSVGSWAVTCMAEDVARSPAFLSVTLEGVGLGGGSGASGASQNSSAWLPKQPWYESPPNTFFLLAAVASMSYTFSNSASSKAAVLAANPCCRLPSSSLSATYPSPHREMPVTDRRCAPPPCRT